MKLKIYFAGSVRGGRENADIFSELIDCLKQFGEVLTEHIGNDNLSSQGEDIDDRLIHNRDLAWVLSSNVMVAEVTTPSLGVGYEIGRAVEKGKKVLCLYRQQEGQRLSGMIAGCPQITCHNYDNIIEAREIIKTFFDNV